jgi:hypothetical protein
MAQVTWPPSSDLKPHGNERLVHQPTETHARLRHAVPTYTQITNPGVSAAGRRSRPLCHLVCQLRIGDRRPGDRSRRGHTPTANRSAAARARPTRRRRWRPTGRRARAPPATPQWSKSHRTARRTLCSAGWRTWTTTSPLRQRPADIAGGTVVDWAGARAFRFGRCWTPGRVRLGQLRTGRGAESSCRRSRVSPAGCPARWWLPAASPSRSTAGPPQ